MSCAFWCEQLQGAKDVDITHVLVKVKPGAEKVLVSNRATSTLATPKTTKAFKKATRENAMESAGRPGGQSM